MAGTGAAKQGPTIFDLAAATGFPPTEKTIKAQLVVPDPNALILFDSQKILIRSDAGTYTNIDNAQWADNLPKLIQARIVQSFENAHQLGAVSRPLEQLDGGISAGTDDPELPDHRREHRPSAVVGLTARLVSDKGAVAGSRVFSASVAAKSAAAADAVAALNEAFAQVAGEIVTWTIGAI